MLVEELYLDCILHERSPLAHCLYHLLAEKKIALHDDISNIDFDQVDHQKVEELIQKNVLGIHKVGIYSLKMDRKTFAFIYAGSNEEAVQFYTKTFRQKPLNCHEYLLDEVLVRGNGEISFRDMRKEFERFPAIAGYFVRDWLI